MAPKRRGAFSRGSFNLKQAADTLFDMMKYKKGLVWVNGRNLGRYLEIGPQRRLDCPAPWLHAGSNEILVFNLLQNEAKPVAGAKEMGN